MTNSFYLLDVGSLEVGRHQARGFAGSHRAFGQHGLAGEVEDMVDLDASDD